MGSGNPAVCVFAFLLACWFLRATDCQAQLPEQWPTPSYSLTNHSGAYESAPVKNSPDQRMVNALRRRLSTAPGVHAYDVKIAARNGVVTLSGLVTDLLAKQRAAELAQTVPGVREVRNQIQVSASQRTDAMLQQDVVRALRASQAVKEYEITTKVQDGFVTLSGTVDSWEEKRLAELLAKGVFGVRGVENKLRVAPVSNREDNDIKADILSRLKWDVWLRNPSIQVTVKNGRVWLSGFASSAAAKERIANDAWVMGVTSVDANGVKVAPNVPKAMRHAGDD